MHNGIEKYNYSICVFTTGKTYHADLNASYNIGARYLIREIIKSLPETAGLEVLAKVPEASKRSTCTLSTLFKLNAVLAAYSGSAGEWTGSVLFRGIPESDGEYHPAGHGSVRISTRHAPYRYNFPRRNRIIAALSEELYVIESGIPKSIILEYFIRHC